MNESRPNSSSSSQNQDSTRITNERPPEASGKWHRQVAAFMVSLLLKRNTNPEEEGNGHRGRKLLITTFTIAFAAWLYHLRKHRRIFATIAGLIGANRTLVNGNEHRRATEAPLSLLWRAAKSGDVQRALILGSQSAIAYEVNGKWQKSSLPLNNPSFQSTLLELLSAGGCTDVSALPESLLSKLATPALAMLPFIYLAFLYRMMQSLQGKDDKARTHNDDESKLRTTFKDVAGLHHAVAEVSEVVSYLSNPSLYHRLGARPPRGILLFGPPGSGKTLLARAVAGEARCDTFVACSGSDFVDTYVGRGASRVRSLFDEARRHARGRKSWWTSWVSPKPASKIPSAVIFIDEIDALAKSRSSGGLASNDERDQTLNQLLTEMDGFAVHEDVTLIVIAATNRPDVLDHAVLRRFDRQVHVGYPDTAGRAAILMIHARNIQCNPTEIDWQHLATITTDFSGADLRNAINEAALLAVRDKSSVVELYHLEQAVDRVRHLKIPSGLGIAPNLVLR